MDDDERFLNLISLMFKNKIPFKTYDDPIKARDKILSKKDKNSNESFSIGEQGKKNHESLDINIQEFHKKIYDKSRFDEVSTLVIDYSMPQCNGIEVCEGISEIPCKKILLTGEADEKIAVKAFNDGVIDYFIRKSEITSSTQLLEKIQELQTLYMLEKYSVVMAALTKARQHASVFNDNRFLDMFHQLCNQHKIIEYYISDSSGSLLLLNKHGNASKLVIRNDEDMQSVYEFVEDNKDQISKETLSSIKERKSILYTGEKDYYSIDPKDWATHLYEANIIQDKKVYWSYVKNDQDYIDEKRLFPFEKYLSQQS
ncbi:MAG: response regulator [Flavobacteriales bacterium]|nr:response regulator [Flavobacteriales bacterium]